MAEIDVTICIHSVRIEGGSNETIARLIAGSFYSDGHTTHHSQYVYPRPPRLGTAGNSSDCSEASLHFWEGTYAQRDNQRGWWIDKAVGGPRPLAYYPVPPSQPASLLWHVQPAWHCPPFAPAGTSLVTLLQSSWHTVTPPPPTGLPVPVLAYKTALQ